MPTLPSPFSCNVPTPPPLLVPQRGVGGEVAGLGPPLAFPLVR